MDSVHLLRHALAALAYRTLRSLHPAPASFTEFRASSDSRTAGEILAHMCDLLDWALRHVNGNGTWLPVAPSTWETDKDRFFAALTQLDLALRDRGESVAEDVFSRLLQGPIADAFTHVGQLALLRGLSGTPVRSENFYVADIAVGRTTAMQPSPKRTF